MRTSLLAGLALVVLCAATSFADGKGGGESRATKPARFRAMLRGYCCAGTKIVDETAGGGFGSSKNFPVATPEGLGVKEGAVALVASPETPAVFRDAYAGMTLHLVNATGEVVWLQASDGRLSIVQEAQDEKGEWKPVEYLPSSSCGNSSHRVAVGPGEAWRFEAPRYTGELKTKLRFRLDRFSAGEPLYSNVFEGSVNPEQFTVKEGHTPSNVMDPYDE